MFRPYSIVSRRTALRRRWWIIALTLAIAAASSYAFTKWQARVAPVYRSEATYIVNPIGKTISVFSLIDDHHTEHGLFKSCT